MALTGRRWPPGSFVEGQAAQRARTRWPSTRAAPTRATSRSATRIQIAGATGAREFTLAGIAKFGSADSPGGATFSLFDLPTAQEFVAKPGFVDAVQVKGDGSCRATPSWPQRIGDQLGPASETEVLTGAEITKESQTEIQDNLKFFTIFLNVVAFIALFVSCFVIYNVFSITVAQRKRENALMRAIGASRRQVTMSLLIESVVVGLVGSIIGLAPRDAPRPRAAQGVRRARPRPAGDRADPPAPHDRPHDRRRRSW